MPPKLGILAGRGPLPRRLAELCRAEGRPVFLLAFDGQTDAETLADFEHAWIRLGAVGRGFELLRAAGVEELVMAGAMRRPALSELKPDLAGAAFIAKAGISALGDDGLLKAIVRRLEEEGFRVRGVDELIGGLLAPAGVWGRHSPDQQARADIERGLAVVRALGAVDVGQAAVVQQGLVLGVEAVEGTDVLLQRCAQLRRDGPGGVLVKISKPGQERRVDLPTIGLATIEGAAAAGLRGIAVEAGGTLVLERAAAVAAADDVELFLVGLEGEE
ncbi:MAG: LpxI family protein [Kiloniellales bacterium]